MVISNKLIEYHQLLKSLQFSVENVHRLLVDVGQVFNLSEIIQR